MFCICVFVLSVFVVLYIVHLILSPKRIDLDAAHVMITGGSLGIGKALAIEAFKQGANVTIIARNLTALNEAKTEIEKHVKHENKQRVQVVSVDLTKEYDTVEKELKQATSQLGPVDVLINCAGTSVCGKFEEIPVEDFKRVMNVNYFGTIHATKAVIEQMKARNQGRIVFVSSQAGQTGIYGFTGYSATKFALRGLAEALQMEVKPYNIRVTVSFPPDTDTPGFAEENKSKPRACRLISETSGLFTASHVAKVILKDTKQGNFQSYVGIDGFMLSNMTCGMCPFGSVLELIPQVLLMSIFRLISVFYLVSFDRIVSKCKQEDEQEKQKYQ